MSGGARLDAGDVPETAVSSEEVDPDGEGHGSADEGEEMHSVSVYRREYWATSTREPTGLADGTKCRSLDCGRCAPSARDDKRKKASYGTAEAVP